MVREIGCQQEDRKRLMENYLVFTGKTKDSRQGLKKRQYSVYTKQILKKLTDKTVKGSNWCFA